MSAAAEAEAESSFYQELTREQAEEAVRLNPQQPLLRPCSYTPHYPRIYAVTYQATNREVLHSLVEWEEGGRMYEIRNATNGSLQRTNTSYSSMEELETSLRNLTHPPENPGVSSGMGTGNRLLLHTSSLPVEWNDVIDIEAEIAATNSDNNESAAFVTRSVSPDPEPTAQIGNYLQFNNMTG